MKGHIEETFIRNLDSLERVNGFSWEMINITHSNFIMQWRNNPLNLVFFENKNLITLED